MSPTSGTWVKRLPHLEVYISVFWICGNVFTSETKIDGNRILLPERSEWLRITPEEIMDIVIFFLCNHIFCFSQCVLSTKWVRYCTKKEGNDIISRSLVCFL